MGTSLAVPEASSFSLKFLFKLLSDLPTSSARSSNRLHIHFSSFHLLTSLIFSHLAVFCSWSCTQQRLFRALGRSAAAGQPRRSEDRERHAECHQQPWVEVSRGLVLAGAEVRGIPLCHFWSVFFKVGSWNKDSWNVLQNKELCSNIFGEPSITQN